MDITRNSLGGCMRYCETRRMMEGWCQVRSSNGEDLSA